MRIPGLLSISLVMVLSASTAWAGVFSGTLCNASGPDAPSLAYGQFGIHNTSTAARAVHCGAVTNRTVLGIAAIVYDRSPTQNVGCTFLVLFADGRTRFTASVATSGSASGPMTLNTLLPVPVAGPTSLHCTLPGAHANGVSHLASYAVAE
jgi:hypothetical protein